MTATLYLFFKTVPQEMESDINTTDDIISLVLQIKY